MEIVPFQPKPKPQGPTGSDPITPKNYHDRVLKFVQASGQCEFPTLELGSPEFEAWRRYFDDHLRWRPITFKMFINDQSKGFTVPTQWPEWFDPAFAGSDKSA